MANQNIYPEVSVIIPVYNGERFIAGTIESVLAQTYKDFELIIIDNGSTDNTYEIIKPFCGLANVRYFEEKKRGAATARNLGVKKSFGEFCAFLDCDDLWMPEKLQEQIGYIRKNTEIALVCADVICIDAIGNILPDGERYPSNTEELSFKNLFSGNNIVTSTVLVKKEILNKAGLFDEALLRSQDYDLWLRIARYHKIGRVNRKLARWRLYDKKTEYGYIDLQNYMLEVLNKALKTIPEAKILIGKQAIRQRLSRAHFKLFDYCRKNRVYLSEGLKHFLAAFYYQPYQAFWKALSPEQERLVRWYFKRIKEIFGIKEG